MLDLLLLEQIEEYVKQMESGQNHCHHVSVRFQDNLEQNSWNKSSFNSVFEIHRFFENALACCSVYKAGADLYNIWSYCSMAFWQINFDGENEKGSKIKSHGFLSAIMAVEY